MSIEVELWPYDFPASADFQYADQRGVVSGRLLVQDRCVIKIPNPSYHRVYIIWNWNPLHYLNTCTHKIRNNDLTTILFYFFKKS